MNLPTCDRHHHGSTPLHARDVQPGTPYVHSKNWHGFTLWRLS
jgi:hypothetical protein